MLSSASLAGSNPGVFKGAFYCVPVPPPPGGPEGGSGLSFSFRGRGFGPDPGVTLILILTLSTVGLRFAALISAVSYGGRNPKTESLYEESTFGPGFGRTLVGKSTKSAFGRSSAGR